MISILIQDDTTAARRRRRRCTCLYIKKPWTQPTKVPLECELKLNRIYQFHINDIPLENFQG
ncbi:MAG: hypothetical protein KKB94_04055, partial [Proteobacteria bacterium]|nr:hypothetical protein [Pseudomonadota bacterium]